MKLKSKNGVLQVFPVDWNSSGNWSSYRGSCFVHSKSNVALM